MNILYSPSPFLIVLNFWQPKILLILASDGIPAYLLASLYEKHVVENCPCINVALCAELTNNTLIMIVDVINFIGPTSPLIGRS